MRRTQQKTVERLELEAMRAIDKIAAHGLRDTQRAWDTAKSRMKEVISGIYLGQFQRSTWNIVDATRYQTLNAIDMRVGSVLADYQDISVKIVSRTLREIYREAVLRQAWILDQTTPPNIRVNLPRSPIFFESARDYMGPDNDTSWKVRWSAWLDAYRDNLYQNLRLGSMNESTVGDARDEVDATRPGSPRSDMWDSFRRIVEHQVEVTNAAAAGDVVGANPDLGIEEIWQTRYYARVCEICQSNAGLTRDEADGDIPAHPNCGCYWRLVPKSWASLLRNGSDKDKSLAKAMDAHGEVPNAMLVFNDDGNLVGSVIVKFNDWVQNSDQSIKGAL